MNKIAKSALTAKIRKADRARDNTYIGMRRINKASLRHHSAAVREAAARLETVFGAYGNIPRIRFNEQTSAITNILQELKGRFAEDTEQVGITDWVTELEARNNTFMDLMRERFSETANRVTIVLREARAEVDAVYFAIRKRINALVVVEGDALYEEFIRHLNAVIAEYASYIK